ncbi:MAG: DedA family protein [Patescibacteria group bacterium]
MEILVNKILLLLGNLDYTGVFLLMTLESSFIPFPSEVIVPPAAYNASQGDLNIFLVVFFGILGSLVGAIINYFLAYYLGRALIYKMADHGFFKLLLINSSKVEAAENFFLRWGRVSTFTGRLIPAVRQLISLPAGFSKMNLGQFCLYTALGAGIWVSILAGLGYYFGANKEVMTYFLHEISNIFWVLGFLVAAYIIFSYKKKKKKAKEAEEKEGEGIK